jgi:hypothetical protein
MKILNLNDLIILNLNGCLVDNINVLVIYSHVYTVPRLGVWCVFIYIYINSSSYSITITPLFIVCIYIYMYILPFHGVLRLSSNLFVEEVQLIVIASIDRNMRMKVQLLNDLDKKLRNILICRHF